MTKAPAPAAFIRRIERVGKSRRVTRKELDDLAAYEDEIKGWANELECKIGDFAANVLMLADPGTPAGERAGMREQMAADAEAVAGALHAISGYCC